MADFEQNIDGVKVTIKEEVIEQAKEVGLDAVKEVVDAVKQQIAIDKQEAKTANEQINKQEVNTIIEQETNDD